MRETTDARPSAMARFRAGYGRVLEWLVIVLVVAMAAEVTLGVVFRTLGRSLVWYDEVASHLLAWLTFYGSALASVRRAHIGCPEIVDKLPAGYKRAASIAAQVLVVAFFALLGWMGVAIMPALSGETLVSLPWVPMNFVHSVIPISSVLIVIAEATHLVDLAVTRAAPEGAAGAALADGLH